MLKLIIEDDEGRKTVIPFARDEITIGRAEGNTIRLTERNVSRRHARLVRQDEHILVEDLGSANGVRVNGDRVVGKEALRSGDLIQIGDYAVAIKSDGDQELARTDETGPIEVGDDAGDTETRTRETATTVPFPPDASASDTGPDPEPTDQSEALPGGAGAATDARHEATGIIRGDQLQANRAREQRALAPGEAPRLVALNTELAGREFPCTKTELRVGRVDDNDLCIDHRSLSRTHCKLVREDDGDWRVLDLQSANGILVNGEPYTQVTLRWGDVLELGHVKLRFLAPGASAPDLRAPAFPQSVDEAEPPQPPAERGHRRALMALGLVVLLVLVAGTALFVWRLQEQLASGSRATRQGTTLGGPGQGAQATGSAQAARSQEAAGLRPAEGPETQPAAGGSTRAPDGGDATELGGPAAVAGQAAGESGVAGPAATPTPPKPQRTREELQSEAARVLQEAQAAISRGDLEGTLGLLGTCTSEALPCPVPRVRSLETQVRNERGNLEAIRAAEKLLEEGNLDGAKQRLRQVSASTKMLERRSSVEDRVNRAIAERLDREEATKRAQAAAREEEEKREREAAARARDEAEAAKRQEALAKENAAIAAFVARAAELNDQARDHRGALDEALKCVKNYPKASECYHQCSRAAFRQVPVDLEEANRRENRLLLERAADCSGSFLKTAPKDSPDVAEHKLRVDYIREILGAR